MAYNLNAQGKYAQAQPLYEKALEINRRLLTDDHPCTANSYNNLAYNLNAQGKYAQAQPLFEKALEIRRRLLTDDHPDTADSYNNVAANLNAQGKYAQAQPLYEKALEIRRRLLTDDHPNTADSYNNVAGNLNAQGKYAQAQPLYEKALEIRRRLLTDDHPSTADSYNNLAYNLNAQGKYLEARDRWLNAVKSLDKARLRVAFTGLERAGGTKESMRPALAAVLTRLGEPAEAWQALEEDLGRGLLDELAARQDRRLAPAERARLRELTTELERLDKLVETTPQGLDQAERAKRFEDLKRQRELASIALGEFQTKLVRDHGPLAGQVARLNEIQAALPADAALVAWVDIAPAGPNAADPDGEHWGVVVRSRGIPAWIPIAGTGPDGLWTKDDTALASRVRTELRRRPGAGPADLRPLIERLRTQRLEPLAKALGTTADGLPPARRLDRPSLPGHGGHPGRGAARLRRHPDGELCPLGHRVQVPAGTAPARPPRRPAGPGRPSVRASRQLERPQAAARSRPAGQRRDTRLQRRDPRPEARRCLARLQRPGAEHEGRSQGHGRGRQARCRRCLEGRPIVPTRSGPRQARRRDRPSAGTEAIAAQRKLQKVLVAARGGGEDFAPLPGTRYEVEALAQLFKSDNRPTRTLLGADASEPELDRLAASGELGRFGFIHLATHGVIDEAVPARSAVILTQTGLPDPLEQALNHKPVFDGRLSVREIQRGWDLKAELVTLSACETALGRDAGGEGFVGFTQALLDVGHAERVPVALEGGRHGDGAVDAAVLRQPAGRPSRVVAATAQGGGLGRGEGVAARVASRGSDGAGGGAVGRRGPGRGGDAAEAGAAGLECAGGRGRRPALCPALLLGRVRTGRRSGLIPIARNSMEARGA